MPSAERRILSVALPQFPVERYLRVQERLGAGVAEALPFALMVEGPHGPVVLSANRAAREAGVEQGARVVDMRARCPELQVAFGDVAGDRAALERLSLWARRWCPWTAVDGAGLVLDTTGAAHLWGGEAALLEEVEARLSMLGLSAQVALGPTWGAAWGLARFGPLRSVCGDLDPLPVAALRLEAETVLLLNRLGLKTVGALRAVPRLSLMRRFARAEGAANPLLRLDQALGLVAEPVSSVEPPPEVVARGKLSEPVFDPTPYLPELCAEVCGQLAQGGQGCRRLRLTVYRTDGEVSVLEVATAAPSRDAAHLLGLFGDRVERINPGFGFDLIELQAVVVEPLEERQVGLAGEADVALELAQLEDRLTARFGAKVHRAGWRASHIPERTAGRGAEAPRTARPVRLFVPPQEVRVLYALPEGPPAQFVWRRQTLQVARYQGPERIAPEWWQDRAGTRLRDYFKVEVAGGQRIWLYREGLAGDGRGERPRWFVHGVFA